MVKTIKLTKGMTAFVDEDDFEYLSRFKWYFKKNHNASGYAYRSFTSNRKTRYSLPMHFFIMNVPNGRVIDHIDGNGLNNTKANLRVATPRQNVRNTKRVTKSGYKGVYLCKNKGGNFYRVCVYTGSQSRDYIFVGRFRDRVNAATAYDIIAYKVHKEFANLNFPEKSKQLFSFLGGERLNTLQLKRKIYEHIEQNIEVR